MSTIDNACLAVMDGYFKLFPTPDWPFYQRIREIGLEKYRARPLGPQSLVEDIRFYSQPGVLKSRIKLAVEERALKLYELVIADIPCRISSFFELRWLKENT